VQPTQQPQRCAGADQAFIDGDLHGIAQTINSLFGENPQALADTVWIGLKALQEKAPEQLQQVLRYAVSEELAGQKIWTELERAYREAQKAGARDAAESINRLAGKFQQRYDIGPQASEAQDASWKSFTKISDVLLTREIEKEIQRGFGVEFSSIAPLWQRELITSAHEDVKDAMARDPSIGRTLEKLLGSYSQEEAINLFLNTVAPKAFSFVPGIVRNLKAQYQNTDVFKSWTPAKKPATSRYAQAKPPAPAPAVRPPSSMAEADSRGMSMAEILRATLSDEERAQAGNPLGLEESRGMTYAQILGTTRPADRTAKITPRSGKLSREEARRMSYSELLNDDRGIE